MERTLRDKLRNGTFGNVSEVHSRRMGAIRGKSNRTTEARFRGMLIRAGVSGWTMQTKEIKGKPDFYFPDRKVAVFVDGCFWHGCSICGHIPKGNRPFWKAKIERNQRRDRDIDAHLLRTGISALRFWEHELRDSPAPCLQRLLAVIKARKASANKRYSSDRRATTTMKRTKRGSKEGKGGNGLGTLNTEAEPAGEALVAVT